MLMSHSTAAVPSLPVPSAQVDPDGTPRFHVLPAGPDATWQATAQIEFQGGVAAEFRAFLDAQLEDGDALLDLAPGFGFVALGAATAPGIAAVVAAVVSDEEAAVRLSTSAVEACTAVQTIVRAPHEGIADAAQRALSHLAEGIRLFVHVEPQSLPALIETLASECATGRVVAILLSPDGRYTEVEWRETLAALEQIGCRPHVLAEQDGELALFGIEDAPPGTPIIALHVAVLATEADTAPIPGGDADGMTDTASGAAPVLWPTRTTALHLIAPFQRTGYGVTGAYLLGALLDLDVPVSFFPMGAVDRSITEVPGLDAALTAQDTFDPWAPSVRLAQQFDLALHVGRGPRVGFPIFESTRFTPRERHHLRAQDRLLVCSEWARGVVLANGILDTPIHVVPLGVDRRVFHEGLVNARGGKETVFLQVGKLEPRKGQHDLLRAFEAAFGPDDAVRLVFACHNPFLTREEFAVRSAPFRSSPMAKRITLRTDPLATHHDVAQLMAEADCGVFCSRAEGWNLEALEMLSIGKPVIATAYSAHTAFLTPANAHLVEIDALEPTDTVGEWAAFGARQHDQLVTHLRAVHEARQSGSLAVNAAGIETAMRTTWRASAEALLAALA